MRWFSAGAILSLLALVTPGLTWAGDAMVVAYLSRDCMDCRVWKESRMNEFLSDSRSNGVRLLTLERARAGQAWPEAPSDVDAKVRDHLTKAPQAQPTTFQFLCDGRRVWTIVGLPAWDSYWEKSLAKLKAACP